MTDKATDREVALPPSKLVAHRGKLERGWRRLALMRELAEGELTQESLAERHGVAQSSISEFSTRHADEIANIRSNLADEFAGLWIARKTNRLAEYEDDVNAINEALALQVDGDDAQLRAAKHRALRAVAEELGQLPNKMQLQAEVQTRVSYTVAGIDPKELQ